MTLCEIKEHLSKMPTLAGKQASVYMCGPKTYDEVLRYFHVKPEEYRPSGMHLAGVRIYRRDNVPDNGKLYPADYIESSVLDPTEAVQ